MKEIIVLEDKFPEIHMLTDVELSGHLLRWEHALHGFADIISDDSFNRLSAYLKEAANRING